MIVAHRTTEERLLTLQKIKEENSNCEAVSRNEQ
jgi:hypothetical protein